MNHLTQTIRSDVSDRLNALLAPNKYLPSDHDAFTTILIEIDKLKQADPDGSAILFAYAIHSTGNLEAALEALDSVKTRGKASMDKVAILANLGKCNEAQKIYSQDGHPGNGHFSRSFNLGLACGAVRKVAEFCRHARKMHLSNLDEVPMENIETADRMLAEFGVEDLQIADLMEVAASVLRDQEMFYVGDGPVLETIDEPSVLRTTVMTYRLPVTPPESVRLYLEFIDRIDLRSTGMPRGLQINFSGTVLS